MVDFIVGFVGGVFIMLLFVQITTKRTITLNGAAPKSENSKRYWVYSSLYVMGCVTSILFMIFI